MKPSPADAPSDRRASARARLGECARWFGLVGALLGVAGEAAAAAPRGHWRTEEESRPGRLSLQARANLSVINFSRPERACTSGGFSGSPVPGPGQLEPPPSFFCPAADSNEVGVGFGFGLGFRVAGPLHLTWGVDIGFTDPAFDILAPQTMIFMPFGVLLTWTEWSVRPLFEGSVTAFALLPDGTKNVMVGGRAGLAVRVGSVDLALSLGYATADALRPWEIRFAVLHLP